MCRRFLMGSIMLAVIAAAGCEQVHEPWVPNPHQLAQERARTADARQVLRHRLMDVQTDR